MISVVDFAKGLNVGAPVAFKGVKIGSVTDIKLLYDERDMSFKIMVTIATEPKAVTQIRGESGVGAPLPGAVRKSLIETLIDQGLQIIVQEFIAEAKGSDFRAIILNGDLIAAMRRQATSTATGSSR